MAKINIFVKLDMGASKGACFHIEPSITVKEFLQLIADKEGAEIETLMFQTKPVRSDKNLNDYAVYNNCTFFASMRLRGGAQDPTVATQFIEAQVTKLGKEYGASVTTEDCIICASVGCYDSKIKKCKFVCGCIYCPDCLKYRISTAINVPGLTQFTCGSSSCGKKPNGTSKGVPINTALAYAIMALDDTKKAEYDAKLAANHFLKATSEMSFCCKDKCKKFMMKKIRDSTLVEKCGHCNTEMCWICKQAKHNNNDPKLCGPITNLMSLLNAGKIDDVYGKQCFNTRICPNKECHRVNKHNKACKHMTCDGCNYQYCHWCLKPWNGHNGAQCVVLPKENPTAKSLYYD
eukprot:352930_1